MTAVDMVKMMEVNLKMLTDERDNINFELNQMEQRRKDFNEALDKINPDIEGLEMAIESLKTTSLYTEYLDEVISEVKEEEPQPEEPKPEEPVVKKADPRGGYKKPLSVIMFGPDNNIRKRWNSMNKCAREMGWTIARVRSMLAMDRPVQLRRYGYYLGAM